MEPNTMASTNHEIEASSVAVRELKARAEWWIIDWLSVERRRQEDDHSFFQLAGLRKGGHEMGVMGYISFFFQVYVLWKIPESQQLNKERRKTKIKYA